MKNIDELYKIFSFYNFHLKEVDSLINWAMNRLENHEEENDNDVVLLASPYDEAEARELSRKILKRYMPKAAPNKELLFGKYIVELYQKYKNGKIEIPELDKIISKIYIGLGYPNWLVMLSQNCEFATDVEPFEKHFKDEFKYIAGLWAECESLEEFKQKYDRKISNSHDI